MNPNRTVLALVAALSFGAAEARESPQPVAQDTRRTAATRAPQPPKQPTPDQAARAFAAFRARVDQYMQLQKRERDKLPPLPEKATPEQVAAYEKEMARLMRALRAQAKPGELFTRKVQPVFLWIVSSEMRGPGSEADRKTAAEGNPRTESGPAARPVVVKVNGPYDDAPQTTMPPDLLRRLPPLPEELGYRFVGRHLTVRDNVSALVVDYILDAAPPLPLSLKSTR